MQTKRTLFAALLVLNALATSALGIWQIERRSWKLDLIATVTARVRAPAVPAPGPVEWPRITAARDAYRHVRVTGRFDNARETMVWAVTGRGEGHWLVTPLYTTQGWTVLINRGFVPAAAARASRPDGPVAISGLLRMTEPGGSFLRRNDPASGRWYSRDVAAIARARGLHAAAPYFIDADARPNEAGYPIGGLTVVTFRNAHLSYALTWFALAALSLWGLWLVLRDPRPKAEAG